MDIILGFENKIDSRPTDLWINEFIVGVMMRIGHLNHDPSSADHININGNLAKRSY